MATFQCTYQWTRRSLRGREDRTPPSALAVHGSSFFSNQLGLAELSTMPKSKSTTGPMNTQPVESTSTMPTPMQPAIGGSQKAAKLKQKQTRTEAVRIAKAKLSRRNSLRMQREALRG
jgi:hypothetical protein